MIVTINVSIIFILYHLFHHLYDSPASSPLHTEGETALIIIQCNVIYDWSCHFSFTHERC